MASFPLKNVANQKKYNTAICAVTGATVTSVELIITQDGNIVTIAYPQITNIASPPTVVTITLPSYFNLVNSTSTLVPTLNTVKLQATLSTSGTTTTLVFSNIGGGVIGATRVIFSGTISGMLAQANLS